MNKKYELTIFDNVIPEVKNEMRRLHVRLAAYDKEIKKRPNELIYPSREREDWIMN
jgi:hypothetical protein